jgi:hypothetical protein
MNIENTTPASDFIERIKRALKKSTIAWRDISDAFSESEKQYGTGSSEFKSILKATGFSLSTASKLIKIARCERLKNDVAKFETVESWTTLYEIASLPDEKYQSLVQELPDGGVVTVASVRKRKKQNDEGDSYRTAFTIRIDENALKASLFDGSHYEALHNLLTQLESTLPYVRVDSAELYEKHDGFEMAQRQRLANRIWKNHADRAIRNAQESNIHWRSFNRLKKKFPMMKPLPVGPWSDEQEAYLAFNEDKKAFFEAIGYEVEEQSVWQEADEQLAQRQRKFAEKSKPPFQAAELESISPDTSAPETKAA